MGKPIPNRRHETDTLSGEVKTYFMTPEQIAALTPAKPVPRSQNKKQMVFAADTNEDRARRRKAPKPSKVTKDDYMALRAAGKSQMECVKALGITISSLRNYWFKRWRLNGFGVEGQAIAKYIKGERDDN